MRRDWNLIRKILLEARDNSEVDIDNFAGYQIDVVKYHVRLLTEGDYFDGSGRFLLYSSTILLPPLTWKAMNFIALIEDDDIWTQASDEIHKAGGMPESILVGFLEMVWLERKSLNGARN